MPLSPSWRRRKTLRRASRRIASEGGGGAALAPLVALCVLSSMQASVLVGPRIYQAMANDRLFFAPLGRVHAATRVPVIGLVAQAAVAIVEFSDR